MTRRLSLFSRLCLGLCLALSAAGAAFAQGNKNTLIPSVAAAATTEQARFLADNEVTNIRLEVLTFNDARLYDSDFKAGNLLDWNWQDAQGQRLADGAYRCIVTVKDLTGHATQRQGILLVQNGATIWQAPEQAEAALRNTAAARTAEGMAYFATVTNPSELTAAVLAHDGKEARLMTGSGGLSVRSGNFLKGTDEELMKLNADGKLEVKGLIQTTEGIAFPDGTVQKTAYVASGQTLKQIAEDGKTKLAPNAPAVGGSGTPNVLLKWAANGVDAVNSTVTDLGPGGGISVNGGVQSTFYNISASGSFMALSPAITGSAMLLRSNSLSGNIWIGNFGHIGIGNIAFSEPASTLTVQGNAAVGAGYYNVAAPTNGLLVQGNVGIGTTAPTDILEVKGVGTAISATDGAVRTRLFSSAVAGAGFVDVQTNHALHLRTNQTERLTITADGRVGIGTALPIINRGAQFVDPGQSRSSYVQIGGNQTFTLGDFRGLFFGDSNFVYIGEGDADDQMILNASSFLVRGGSVRPDTDGGQNLGTAAKRWNTVFASNGTINTSDKRLKKDITKLNYGLSAVMQLRPVSFGWKDNSDNKTHLGLIAQEVAEVVPEVVYRDANPDTALGMNYAELVPVLIKAVQEQQTQLTQRNQTITQLTKRLVAVERKLSKRPNARR